MPIMPQYRSPYGQSIAELLMRQGDIAARGAERSGEIWGRVAENLGNIGAQAYTAHREQKDQEKREAMLGEAMSTFDPQNPMDFYRRTAIAVGPEAAMRVTSGMSSLMKMQQTQQPDPKDAATVVQGLAALEGATPGYLRKNWATVGQALKPVGAVFGIQLPDDPAQLPEDFGQQIIALNQGLNQKDGGAKTRQVEVLNPDGTKSIQIVEDKPGQTFTSAAPAQKTLADIQAEAEARARGTRIGNPPQPPQPKVSPLESVDPKWRTVIDRASLMMPGIRRPAFEAAIGRIAATGNMDELGSVVKQAAVEGENVDVKNQVVGRMATIASIEDARSILTELQAKGVPTGWLSGNMEDLARKLGKTTNPEYVALGNRLAGTLINYRRAATGVQFGDKEQAQYEKMFPNYRQELPVNLALIDGLMREMRTYDRVYWENKLGKDGARLVGALSDESSKADSGGEWQTVGGARIRKKARQ